MTHPSAHPSDDPNPPGDKPCSSPPCYAAEFPGYFGDGPAQQVVDGLNALLEAERAGARVLEGIPSAHPNGNCGRSADSRMEPLHPAEVERSNR